MSLDMFEKMVRPDESPAAGGADELLLPCVSSLVTGELVAACEYLVTVRIWTVERFLSWTLRWVRNYFHRPRLTTTTVYLCVLCSGLSGGRVCSKTCHSHRSYSWRTSLVTGGWTDLPSYWRRFERRLVRWSSLAESQVVAGLLGAASEDSLVRRLSAAPTELLSRPHGPCSCWRRRSAAAGCSSTLWVDCEPPVCRRRRSLGISAWRSPSSAPPVYRPALYWSSRPWCVWSLRLSLQWRGWAGESRSWQARSCGTPPAAVGTELKLIQ